MTTANIKYQVEMAAVDKDLAKAVNDARNALASAEKAMIEAYTKSPRYQAMLDLTGYGDSGYGKVPIYPDIQGSRIVCRVMVDVEQVSRQQLYLDPKTTNLLLSGKLLTDDEKRQLLKDMGVELPKPEGLS